MPAEWKTLARRGGHVVSGEGIRVEFLNGRQQVVFVDDAHPGVYRLWSIILPPKKTQDFTDGEPLTYAWKRNRFSDLVGFTLDERARLIGESWAPAEGLSAETFAVYVREVARVCELHEFRLAGVDDY